MGAHPYGDSDAGGRNKSEVTRSGPVDTGRKRGRGRPVGHWDEAVSEEELNGAITQLRDCVEQRAEPQQHQEALMKGSLLAYWLEQRALSQRAQVVKARRGALTSMNNNNTKLSSPDAALLEWMQAVSTAAADGDLRGRADLLAPKIMQARTKYELSVAQRADQLDMLTDEVHEALSVVLASLDALIERDLASPGEGLMEDEMHAVQARALFQAAQRALVAPLWGPQILLFHTPSATFAPGAGEQEQEQEQEEKGGDAAGEGPDAPVPQAGVKFKSLVTANTDLCLHRWRRDVVEALLRRATASHLHALPSEQAAPQALLQAWLSKYLQLTVDPAKSSVTEEGVFWAERAYQEALRLCVEPTGMSDSHLTYLWEEQRDQQVTLTIHLLRQMLLISTYAFQNEQTEKQADEITPAQKEAIIKHHKKCIKSAKDSIKTLLANGRAKNLWPLIRLDTPSKQQVHSDAEVKWNAQEEVEFMNVDKAEAPEEGGAPEAQRLRAEDQLPDLAE